MIRPATDFLFDPSYSRWRRELETLQWRDAEFIRDFQWRRIRIMLEHAYAAVPHYREVLGAAGLLPETLTPDAFSEAPILSRRTLREKFPLDITARGVNLARIRPVRTSGSTSEPVRVYPDPQLRALSRATFHWLNQLAGVSITDRRLHLDTAPGSPNWLYRARYWAGRAYRASADPVLRRDGPAVAALLNRRRPHLITSYPSLLRLAALALDRGGLALDFTPTAICYQSESMDQETYDLVRRTFGAPVYSRYGIREVSSFVAQSCPLAAIDGRGPARDLHVNALAFFVEVVDADGRPAPAGQKGRLLVTDLWNRVTPLLRYETGDIASLAAGPCSCGRGLPRLEFLDGRETEYLILPSGRTLPATALFPPLMPWMDRLWTYQWVRTAERRIEISVVPVGREFGSQEAADLEDAVVAFLGEPMEVSVRIVDDIPPERSGKRPHLRILGADPGAGGRRPRAASDATADASGERGSP